MKPVIIIGRGSSVKHLAVEVGMRTRTLCGQVELSGPIPPVSQTRGGWEYARDETGTDSRHRRWCGTCMTAWADWQDTVDGMLELEVSA